jgi:hypothetical protein
VRPLFFLVAVLALAACGGSDEASAPRPTSSAPAAREIAGETLDGSRLSLAEFRGKPVVVNIWSSW